MRLLQGSFLVGVMLLAAACGSASKPAGSGSSTRASGPTAMRTTTATTTVTLSDTSTIASMPVGPQPCVAAELALSSLGQQGGMGHGELGFAFKNTSSATCRTGGYPGVLFLDQAGHTLPTASTRVTRDFFGATPVVRITLAPGQSASFRLGVTHEAQGNASCTTASALQAIAPNDTATLQTAIANGGAYECQTVTVSPLRPGSTAYP